MRARDGSLSPGVVAPSCPGLSRTGRAGYWRSRLRRGRSSFLAVRCSHLSTAAALSLLMAWTAWQAAKTRRRRSSLSAQRQGAIGPANLENESVAADVVEPDLDPGLEQSAGEDGRDPSDVTLVETDLLANADGRLQGGSGSAADAHLGDDETRHMERLRRHQVAQQEVEIRDDPEAGIEAAILAEQGAMVEHRLMGQVVAATPEFLGHPWPVHETQRMPIMVDKGHQTIDHPVAGQRAVEMGNHAGEDRRARHHVVGAEE